MKKVVSIVLILVLAISTVGCGINLEVTDIPDIKVNAGMITSKDGSVPAELMAAYNIAVSKYDYEVVPKAYVKLTVDDGINYGILCRRAEETDDVVKDYKCVVLHQDDAGNIHTVSVVDIAGKTLSGALTQVKKIVESIPEEDIPQFDTADPVEEETGNEPIVEIIYEEEPENTQENTPEETQTNVIQ